MKLGKLTKTFIELFERCPHSFLLMMGKKTESGVESKGRKAIRYNEVIAVGNAVHSVLKEYMIGDERMARKGLIALLVQPKLVDEADEMLVWIKHWCHLLGPIAVEVQIPVHIKGLPPCQVAFDMLVVTEDTVRVLEVKTGWKVMGQEDLANSLESRWYKLMLDVMYPDKPNKQITYLYARTLTIVNVEPVPLKVSYLQDMVKLIEEGPYLPNYGGCSFCQYILECSQKESGFSLEATARNYLKSKARADAYFSQLKQSVRDKELKVDDHAFYWATISSYKIVNPKLLWSLIKEAGVYIKPDMDDLRKKAQHLILEALQQDIMEVKHYSKFMVTSLKE